MPWKFEKETSTDGDTDLEKLIEAIKEAQFIAEMEDQGIPQETLATRGKLSCVVCEETIHNYDDARRCEKKPMHNDCLVCMKCNRNLGDFQVKFFKNKECKLFFCEECLFADAEKCPYCKELIEPQGGKYYRGRKYHRNCVDMVDVCDECGRSLVDSTHMLEPEPEIPEGGPESEEEPTPEPPSSPDGAPSEPMTEGGAPEALFGEGEGEEEEEPRNLLVARKQYCQECFKNIYDMEICHVCKGPLKKREKASKESRSSLEESLKQSQMKLQAHQAGKGGGAAKITASKAFAFPDGMHPEDFLFEDYICHWDCMKCKTCQKNLIGQQSFYMAEKHRVWCKFCAQNRFGLKNIPLNKKSSSASTISFRGVTSVGSNIQIGEGFDAVREFRFQPQTAKYVMTDLASSSLTKVAQPKTPAKGGAKSPPKSPPKGK